MIGLTLLAVGLLWLALSLFIAIKLPRWIGIKREQLRWLLSGALLLLCMVGPFANHIVGMWQFQKLCNEQTGLQIYPNAVNTKRAREFSSDRELLNGMAIPIYRTESNVINLETNAVIARYSRFTTSGAGIGKILKLGGEDVCSVNGSRHKDHQKYLQLKTQTNLRYGD
jgi:hypothetical protein